MDCNEDYRREAYDDRMRESVCRGCPGAMTGDCGGCRWSGECDDDESGDEENESEELNDEQ